MNQISQTGPFLPTGEGSESNTGKNTPNWVPKKRLTADDTKAIHEELTQGETALAQRRDLGDMYKRLVGMITTLDQGMKDRQAAQDMAGEQRLTARLEGVERAINEVEGVLRIEIEPMLHKAVDDAVAGRLPHQRVSKGRTVAGAVLRAAVLVGAIYVGAIYSSEVKGLAQSAQTGLSHVITSVSAVLSPDGGIGDAANRVE